MKDDKDIFLTEASQALAAGNLAIFAGAGLSMPAGFVSWSNLLRPIAEELGLDVDNEQDLVALAQYHCNENGNNRSQLNQRLIDAFVRESRPTENHAILSRLPINTYWTTNYDSLIEDSLIRRGKLVDVKHTVNQLPIRQAKRDAVVYKMHGDAQHPDQAVLTRDDYERYSTVRGPYIDVLKSDLAAKTFLFLGFSFTDVNLNYILSRIRLAFAGNQRRHYCIMRRVDQDKVLTNRQRRWCSDGTINQLKEEEYRHQSNRLQLLINDLKRFNIKVVLIDNYDEITDLLRQLEIQNRQKRIFISGAAHGYDDPWTESTALAFVQSLSQRIIQEGFSIVSGFGLGIGSAVISGALEELYREDERSIAEHLILRPFPQDEADPQRRAARWQQYRQDMIAPAGIGIFLFGNKRRPASSNASSNAPVNHGDSDAGGEAAGDSEIILSDGMNQEYAIANQHQLAVIPVAITQFMARQIWEREKQCLEQALEQIRTEEITRNDQSLHQKATGAGEATGCDCQGQSPAPATRPVDAYTFLFQSRSPEEREYYRQLFMRLNSETCPRALMEVILEMIRFITRRPSKGAPCTAITENSAPSTES
jgi:hypothetical protein